MTESRLSALQLRVLELLADLHPQWTLTGGGALAGFHLGHRGTRDLDLFWHGHERLGNLGDLARDRLERSGLTVLDLERADAFRRMRVADGSDEVLLDLVAEPVPFVDPPQLMVAGSVRILVDSRHEIFVNKLCTLLSRSELRDLVDVRALLQAGGDLERASRDAVRKDGGYSPLMLQWVLRGFPVAPLASRLGYAEADAAALVQFRDELVEALARLTLGDAQ